MSPFLRSLAAALAACVAGCGAGPTVAAPVNVDAPAATASTAASSAMPPTLPSEAALSTDPAAPTVRADGLQIVVLKPGTGAKAKLGDRLRVDYVGTLADGTEFDSSRKPGRQPFVFKLGAGSVIKGWELGTIGMQVGELRKLVVPPELGYGQRSMAGLPPNATLTFEIELIAIE